jgi:starch synthase
VPLVRETGGLADTVKNFIIETEEGNGFSFKEYSSRMLLKTIVRAISVYKNLPDIWEKIVKQAISEDFSWKNVSDNYVDLYKKAIDKVF